MSTDQTPALARATEALVDTYLDSVKGDEDEHYRMGNIGARAVVSAALHDPDGALARTLCRRIHRLLWPLAAAPDPDQPGCANCREHVSVLRAAILGDAS